MLYLGKVIKKDTKEIYFEGHKPIQEFKVDDIIELDIDKFNLIVKINNIEDDDYGFWAETVDFDIRIDNGFFDVSPH